MISKISKKILALVMAVLMMIGVGGVNPVNAEYDPTNGYIYSSVATSDAHVDYLHTYGSEAQNVVVRRVATTGGNFDNYGSTRNGVQHSSTDRIWDGSNIAAGTHFATLQDLYYNDDPSSSFTFQYATSENSPSRYIYGISTGAAENSSYLKLWESVYANDTYYAASERSLKYNELVQLWYSYDSSDTSNYRTVTYHTNDATTGSESDLTTINYKQNSTIQSTSYESIFGSIPSGKTFAGWSLSKNGTAVAPGGTAIAKLTSNTNLYAIYTESTVTLNYTTDSYYGTVNPTSEDVGIMYGVPKGSTVAANNTHGSFDGWYVNDNLVSTNNTLDAASIKTKAYNTTTKLFSGTTFVAKFSPNVITAVDDQTVTYNGATHAVATTTVKDKTGTTTDANAKVQYSEDGTTWKDAPTSHTDPGTYITYVRAVDTDDNNEITRIARTTEKLIISKAPADSRFEASLATASDADITYDYVAHTPEVSVTDNVTHRTLVKGTDYTVAYTGTEGDNDVTNVGTKTITITGMGDYYTTGSVPLTYNINALPINNTNFFISDINERFYYDGLPHQGTLTVKDLNGKVTLTENTDYTLTYPSDITNAGTKTVTITPIGNYKGNAATRTYVIDPMDVSKTGNKTKFIVSSADPDTHVYNGTVQYSGVKFSTAAGNTNVITSADYDITYNDQGTEALTALSKNVGTKVITVTPKGNYTNTGDAITRTYAVTPAESSTCFRVGSISDYNYYDGTTPAQKPNYVMSTLEKTQTQTLIENTDYTISIVDDGGTEYTPNAGTKVATITPMGNYTGTTYTRTFEINQAWAQSRFTVTAVDDLDYNGNTQEPVLTIKDNLMKDTENNPIVLTEGTDYQVAYSDTTPVLNSPLTKNVGEKEVMIAGLGNYTGQTATFYNVVTVDSTDHFDVQTIADVTFNHASQTPAPTVLDKTIKDASGNPATLVSGTDYDVTYSADTTNAGTVTVTLNAKGNYEDTPADDFVTATYKINPLEVLQSELSLSTYTFVYNGSEQTPDLTVTDQYGYELKQGSDYTVLADSVDYTNAGTKYATIVPKNNYTNAGNTLRIAYVINPKNISEDVNITVDPVVYDGSEHKQAVTVVTKEGTKLVEGTDYTVSYPDSDYENLGTKNVTVTFKGNYTGSASASYKITRTAGVSMYRLYNANSGEHFYTASADERDTLTGIGWSYEGIGWTAPKLSSTPVYRMYNDNGGEHHYTTSAAERDSLLEAGWSYEGIGWYSDDTDEVPLYRLYNPNAYANNHHYTSSEGERDYLMSIGWSFEGIGWYGM